MLVNSGTYVGNSTAARQIVGVGFQPDLVIVKSLTQTYDTWFKTKDMASTQSFPTRADAASATDKITSLDANGFTIGSIQDVNNTGQTFAWIAFKDNGAGDFATFTYTGDATDDKLVFTGFQPDYAMIKSNGTITGAEKFVGQASALATPASNVASMLYQSGADRADLMAFTSSGIYVSNGSGSGGNLVNQNALSHFGYCFKNVAGLIQAGSYTGNGATQTIATTFKPAYINIHAASAQQPVTQYECQQSGGFTQPFDGYQITGKITATTAAGFSLANEANVNGNAVTFWYIAIGSTRKNQAFFGL